MWSKVIHQMDLSCGIIFYCTNRQNWKRFLVRIVADSLKYLCSMFFPKAWAGSYQGKENSPSVVLEGIADYHMFFGI